MTHVVKIYQIANTIKGETFFFLEFAVVNRTFAVGNGFKALETQFFCKKYILQLARYLRGKKHNLLTTISILRC